VNDRQTVVAAYDASEEAADGLALARLLAAATDSELLVTRVLENHVPAPVVDAATQREIRARVGETRRAMLAAVPDDGLSAAIRPVLDPRVTRGLHDVARANDAALLVLGSTHHSNVGRVLFGGTADAVIDQAPCPVAIAPPSFRHSPHIAPEPIGCAYDGSLASVDALLAATDLARTMSVPLRVICVDGHDRTQQLFADADALVRDTSDGTVELECIQLEGDVANALVAETEGRTGLLVMGSRGLGPIRRALLGSVSRKVVHHASCPVIVTPRRR
jgi:nucleotide-binding universal stress UspA family protein